LQVNRDISQTVATNFYAYCGNNPVNYTDPFGLSTQVDEKPGTIFSYTHDGDNGVYAYPTYEGQRVAGPAGLVGFTTTPTYFSDARYIGSDIRNFEIGGSGLYGTLTVRLKFEFSGFIKA
jgi:hypothetical protein